MFSRGYTQRNKVKSGLQCQRMPLVYRFQHGVSSWNKGLHTTVPDTEVPEVVLTSYVRSELQDDCAVLSIQDDHHPPPSSECILGPLTAGTSLKLKRKKTKMFSGMRFLHSNEVLTLMNTAIHQHREFSATRIQKRTVGSRTTCSTLQQGLLQKNVFLQNVH